VSFLQVGIALPSERFDRARRREQLEGKSASFAFDVARGARRRSGLGLHSSATGGEGCLST
jgi:hypothetical protein